MYCDVVSPDADITSMLELCEALFPTEVISSDETPRCRRLMKASAMQSAPESSESALTGALGSGVKVQCKCDRHIYRVSLLLKDWFGNWIDLNLSSPLFARF